MEQSASAEIQAATNDLLNLIINSKSQGKWLANDISKMLESSKPPLPPECCIYKVPTNLRIVNEKAYTPQHISIGPFHHGDERLETMEKLKVTYLKRFVHKATLNVENLVSIVRHREADVRRCYSHTSGLSSDDYVKMILLDASFIIVFFKKCKHKEWMGPNEKDLTPWLINALRRDIRLLENQLLFFVIEELYNFAFASHSNLPSFTDLAIKFLKRSGSRDISHDPNLKIRHFVDLLRTSFLPQSISQSLPKRNRHDKVRQLYSASQLVEAGVKLKMSSSKLLFDLKFTNGVLEIPTLKFDDKTESLFRNIMALEQCHYPFDGYFTDYIRVLDFLIDTPNDVDLLVQKRIIVNGLGDSNAVSTLVNNLWRQIFISEVNSDYIDLCNDLNNFYGKRCNRWKATLRHDYLSTPWRIASTAAAIILLLLTFTQTVCSIISLWYI